MPKFPKRVVVINDRSTMVGGASNLAVLSARLLEGQGFEVLFFAGDAAGASPPAANTINLDCAPLTQQGRLHALVDGLYNSRAYAAMRKIVEQDDPSTIYHVHGWSKILSPSIFRALAPVRHRVVLHAHDYFLACPNGGFVNFGTKEICNLSPMTAKCLSTQCDKRGYHEKLWRSLRHVIRGQLFPIGVQAPNIIIVHQRMREYLVKSGIDVSNVCTIRNPVEGFRTPPERPWSNSSFFFIGRLEPEKGFLDAAQAARSAGARLHVIGDGAGRALLERDFPEVVIHGWQDRAGMEVLIQGARAVIVSSRVPEPFSLAAVEAVVSGIPVIVPDAALIGAEIAEQGCGLTFRSGDVASLTQAIRAMQSDDRLVEAMAGNCLRAGPCLGNTAESWGEALVDCYSSVLAGQDVPRAIA